jgi:plasmid stabilization system protein ParE
MNDLILHPVAQTEYEAATAWYAEKSAAVSDRFIAEVEAAIHEVHRYPERYALVDDQHRLCLVASFPYYVGYRLRPGVVEVVAIRHAARDQNAWQER